MDPKHLSKLDSTLTRMCVSIHACMVGFVLYAVSLFAIDDDLRLLEHNY